MMSIDRAVRRHVEVDMPLPSKWEELRSAVAITDAHVTIDLGIGGQWHAEREWFDAHRRDEVEAVMAVAMLGYVAHVRWGDG